jgi:hypothetical protein
LPINSIPAASKAPTNFTKESTLPRITFAGLHSLNGRNGQVRQLSQTALVDRQKGAGGSQLRGGDHDVLIMMCPRLAELNHAFSYSALRYIDLNNDC